jgi:WhiB family redox-sensing transcriptional regulator
VRNGRRSSPHSASRGIRAIVAATGVSDQTVQSDLRRSESLHLDDPDSEWSSADPADMVTLPDVLAEMFNRPAWHALAACRGQDPALWFPGRGARTGPAKDICAGCTVRERCLDVAIDNGERDGIWGGLSERQRRAVRDRSRQAS